jgi:hypothetical protein
MFLPTDDATKLRGDWLFPNEIRFGTGRVGELPAVLSNLGMRRPLIVTDAGLSQAGIPERIMALASGPVSAGYGTRPLDEHALVSILVAAA